LYLLTVKKITENATATSFPRDEEFGNKEKANGCGVDCFIVPCSPPEAESGPSSRNRQYTRRRRETPNLTQIFGEGSGILQ
jgi:hypothetical protein